MNAAAGSIAPKLLAFGWLPLPWFIVWVTVGGLLVPGYSAMSQHASELTLVPGLPSIAIKLAALGTGASILLFAAGLWTSSDRKISWGAMCWMVFGLSMLSNGIWNMGDPRHGFYAIGIANIVAPALALAESRNLSDDGIAYRATVIVSLANVFYLWLILTGNDPEGFRGLSQRVFSSINSTWPMIVAWRMCATNRILPETAPVPHGKAR